MWRRNLGHYLGAIRCWMYVRTHQEGRSWDKEFDRMKTWGARGISVGHLVQATFEFLTFLFLS